MQAASVSAASFDYNVTAVPLVLFSMAASVVINLKNTTSTSYTAYFDDAKAESVSLVSKMITGASVEIYPPTSFTVPYSKRGKLTITGNDGSVAQTDYLYYTPVASNVKPVIASPDGGTVVQMDLSYLPKNAKIFFGDIQATDFSISKDDTKLNPGNIRIDVTTPSWSGDRYAPIKVLAGNGAIAMLYPQFEFNVRDASKDSMLMGVMALIVVIGVSIVFFVFILPRILKRIKAKRMTAKLMKVLNSQSKQTPIISLRRGEVPQELGSRGSNRSSEGRDARIEMGLDTPEYGSNGSLRGNTSSNMDTTRRISLQQQLSLSSLESHRLASTGSSVFANSLSSSNNLNSVRVIRPSASMANLNSNLNPNLNSGMRNQNIVEYYRGVKTEPLRPPPIASSSQMRPSMPPKAMSLLETRPPTIYETDSRQFSTNSRGFASNTTPLDFKSNVFGSDTKPLELYSRPSSSSGLSISARPPPPQATTNTNTNTTTANGVQNGVKWNSLGVLNKKPVQMKNENTGMFY